MPKTQLHTAVDAPRRTIHLVLITVRELFAPALFVIFSYIFFYSWWLVAFIRLSVITRCHEMAFLVCWRAAKKLLTHSLTRYMGIIGCSRTVIIITNTEFSQLHSVESNPQLVWETEPPNPTPSLPFSLPLPSLSFSLPLPSLSFSLPLPFPFSSFPKSR